MVSRKNGEQARPMRVAFASVSPPILGALEHAFGRLDGTNDPRLQVLTADSVAHIKVAVIDPPVAGIVRSPASPYETLAIRFSRDDVWHHREWHGVADYFDPVPGRLPREPARAKHPLAPAEIAALQVELESADLEQATAHFGGLNPEQVGAVEVAPVELEAATVESLSGSGTRSLFVCHTGVWWPTLTIRRNYTRRIAERQDGRGRNYPAAAII